MVKTHEKSRIYAVVGTDNVKNVEKVVLQMEATGQMSGGRLIYLVETVAAEDYDRTTAEGRAATAEEELKEYKKTISEKTDNLNAEKAGARFRTKFYKAKEEGEKLYKALAECRRIFGELPPEIEKLLNSEEGEKDHGNTCTI